MTKDEALQSWFASAVHNWEIPVADGVAKSPVRTDSPLAAYPSASVPDDAVLPYLTYDTAYSSWELAPVAVTVNLWFHTSSVDVPDAAARELSKAVGYAGARIPCDNGYIWLKRGAPFSKTLPIEDPNLKLCHINLTAEFLTVD